MANKRSSPAKQTGIPSIIAGRVSLGKVDGLICDTDSGGDLTPSSPKEQGSPDHARDSSSSGNRAIESLLIEGDRGVPEPATPSPSAGSPSNPFTSGEGVLKTLADRFNAAREIGKVGAWRQFQRDLMDASPFLVPHLLPYKDLITIVSDIEKEIKGSNATAGRSNEEILADFLSGKTTLGADLTAPAPSDLDNSAILTSLALDSTLEQKEEKAS